MEKISLVIPAYNEELYIAATLAAILDEISRNGAGADTEIVVVNNASTDRTAEIASQFSDVRVLREPVKGLARSRQTGIDATDGEIIAFLDADTTPLPGWLTTIRKEFAANPRVVCVSGPYFYHDLPYIWRVLSWPYEIIFGSIAHFFTGQCIAGGNMAIRRSALLKVGGFNKNLVFYGEDLELASRLKDVGKIIFTPRLCVASSARRFNVDGVIMTTVLYAGNFLSQTIRNRPISDTHRDIR